MPESFVFAALHSHDKEIYREKSNPKPEIKDGCADLKQQPSLVIEKNIKMKNKKKTSSPKGNVRSHESQQV